MKNIHYLMQSPIHRCSSIERAKKLMIFLPYNWYFFYSYETWNPIRCLVYSNTSSVQNMNRETDVEFSTSVILRFIYTRSSTKNW